MLNLIQETDQELMNHICGVCDKSFPSGRSLGGHMRSHVINSDHHHHDEDDDDDHHQHQDQNQKKKKKKLSCVNNGGLNSKDLGYELRKGPKKTPKVKDSSEVNNNNNGLVVLDKLCKECGKGFQSWKALFGHMKCHSEKVHTNKNMNQDSRTSQSENENSGAKTGRIKKSRSRNKRMKRYTVTSTTVTTTTTTITTASSSISMNANNNNNHASTSVVSDIEQDQESEIAMCLIMLSRDEGKWGDKYHENEASDHCKSSAFVRLDKVEGKKPTGNGSKVKKIGETEIGGDYLGRSEVGSTGLEKIVIKNDEFDDKMESSKRKFECVTCNKSFHSYQALGGHKAGHKKLKESLDSKLQDDNKAIENKPFFNHDHVISNDQAVGSLKKTVVLGAHECAICLKVFSSGQALGGHKRSHMIAEAKLNQQTSMNLIEKVDEQIRETRGFIDLNMLPDTMEDDMIMNSSPAEYKPWHWVDTTNHESTTLLGLLTTS